MPDDVANIIMVSILCKKFNVCISRVSKLYLYNLYNSGINHAKVHSFMFQEVKCSVMLTLK